MPRQHPRQRGRVSVPRRAKRSENERLEVLQRLLDEDEDCKGAQVRERREQRKVGSNEARRVDDVAFRRRSDSDHDDGMHEIRREREPRRCVPHRCREKRRDKTAVPAGKDIREQRNTERPCRAT
eukprot:Amastigsp_a9968_10.p3 type:complete len:125 gc:universal Amastigsp_a9968_10:150-524(+)